MSFPHSNGSETPTEPDRTLFELVRRTSESTRAHRTDLSRRLRDGVSLLAVLARAAVANLAAESKLQQFGSVLADSQQ